MRAPNKRLMTDSEIEKGEKGGCSDKNTLCTNGQWNEAVFVKINYRGG